MLRPMTLRYREVDEFGRVRDWQAEPGTVIVNAASERLPKGWDGLPAGVEMTLYSGLREARWSTTAQPFGEWVMEPEEAIAMLAGEDRGQKVTWYLDRDDYGEGRIKAKDPGHRIGLMMCWGGKMRVRRLPTGVVRVTLNGKVYAGITLSELAHAVLKDVAEVAPGFEWRWGSAAVSSAFDPVAKVKVALAAMSYEELGEVFNHADRLRTAMRERGET